MVRSSTLVLLVCGFVAVAALTGCQAGEKDAKVDPYQVCTEHENKVFRELEQLAEAQFKNVGSDPIRVGWCEDTGQPFAQLSLTVTTWQTRKASFKYLARMGWQKATSGDAATSPDGRYSAQPISGKSSSGEKQVDLRLYRSADFPKVAGP